MTAPVFTGDETLLGPNEFSGSELFDRFIHKFLEALGIMTLPSDATPQYLQQYKDITIIRQTADRVYNRVASKAVRDGILREQMAASSEKSQKSFSKILNDEKK